MPTAMVATGPWDTEGGFSIYQANETFPYKLGCHKLVTSICLEVNEPISKGEGFRAQEGDLWGRTIRHPCWNLTLLRQTKGFLASP